MVRGEGKGGRNQEMALAFLAERVEKTAISKLESFIAAVRGETPPVVSAEDGLAAVELATRIVESMARQELA